jgi:hypothetical protein
MIKQVFAVEHYWKVIVYYDMDYNFFSNVYTELKKLGASDDSIWELHRIMISGQAKAVTFNSPANHTSIVIFNVHESTEDYLNSIVHEAEHIKQTMLQAYQVEDKGEPPAYTIGYLVMRMYEVFKDRLCS